MEGVPDQAQPHLSASLRPPPSRTLADPRGSPADGHGFPDDIAAISCDGVIQVGATTSGEAKAVTPWSQGRERLGMPVLGRSSVLRVESGHLQ